MLTRSASGNKSKSITPFYPRTRNTYANDVRPSTMPIISSHRLIDGGFESDETSFQWCARCFWHLEKHGNRLFIRDSQEPRLCIRARPRLMLRAFELRGKFVRTTTRISRWHSWFFFFFLFPCSYTVDASGFWLSTGPVNSCHLLPFDESGTMWPSNNKR